MAHDVDRLHGLRGRAGGVLVAAVGPCDGGVQSYVAYIEEVEPYCAVSTCYGDDECCAVWVEGSHRGVHGAAYYEGEDVHLACRVQGLLCVRIPTGGRRGHPRHL